MSCVPKNTAAKLHKNLQFTITLYKKSAKFYVILAENCSDWKEIVVFGSRGFLRQNQG